MKSLIRLLVIGIFIQSAAGICFSQEDSNKPFYLGGIQVNEPDHQVWAKALKRNSLNTVAVTVYAKQGNWNTSNIWFNKEEQAVISEIKAAKKEELEVILILRVALDHKFEKNKFLWHGMIMPTSKNELEQWFVKYKKFVNKWAKIAEELNVDVFGIGSEMNYLASTTQINSIPPLIEYYLNEDKQRNKISLISKSYKDIKAKDPNFIPNLVKESEAFKKWALEITDNIDLKSAQLVKELNKSRKKLNQNWLSIIKETRKHYKGKLLYAANFDQFKEVGFWNELDFIGINAYFPLRTGNKLENETSKDLNKLLIKGWKNIFDDIELFKNKKNIKDKKVIFSELGYTFKEGSSIAPWASNGYSLDESHENPKIIFWKQQEENYFERIQAIEALATVTAGYTNTLAGVLYWKLSTIKSHIEIEPFVHILDYDRDKDFTKSLIKLMYN